MQTTIFNKDISNNILYDFLELNCILENNYYILDRESYKKYEFNDQISNFYNKIEEYYKKILRSDAVYKELKDQKLF